ncbi:(5-formylfuran-3-yl)methyl phosphate synthase [Novipirellula artificiosorum]|uniref:(5-formylfuran-3-yl)methyl phosphate synthase n=1 Tax=Novipirellula artificiosorum TaxID=2528016 RepID=A0A5C6DZH0_9BACT|nr:(5-formylfuran-3-yl)methyl phosphate synthase [Novipirellula artificiosorum]TWU42012.1 hypothetical protein Poly41_03080 [Novipirellula artificiosorum]
MSHLVTDLLVSVRDLREYAIAVAAGVTIIDFKEPDHGPLAAVDAAIWQQSASAAGRSPNAGDLSAKPPLMSAALGEAVDYVDTIDLLPRQFHFAKIGPSGIVCPEELKRIWLDARQRLSQSTGGGGAELVAVAYADHDAAGCLPPEAIFQLAADLGFHRCLIDTFHKDGASTLDHVSRARLGQLSKISRRASMRWMIAGSIRIEMVDSLETPTIEPDGYAVRGDVCEAGRTAGLSPSRLAAWVEKVASLRPVETRQ